VNDGIFHPNPRAEEISLCSDVGGDVGEVVLRSITEVEGDIMEVSQGGCGYRKGVKSVLLEAEEELGKC